MGCKVSPSTPPIPCKFLERTPKLRTRIVAFFSPSSSQSQQGEPVSTATPRSPIQLQPKTDVHSIVKFQSLGACKLGISMYPDFEYNAEGGTGIGTATDVSTDEISVCFDLKTLYIPPLTSATSRFLGVPLPPFLRVDIVPELFQGSIHQASGKVGLEFKAKFCFSVGSIYRAPPLLVETLLTSEESKGTMRSGRGKRLDEAGNCRLVGVAAVAPIDDLFMNTFLGLPTECLANLNAIISITDSS
ncbi:uncharacterized protein LOC131146790 [Malania oleifera]|uniref:uncharacterized protein LOC131146790 n=1 Tax=Malania oleifera TaxID=397392 RepID=UPI0025AE7F1B|nr:uncharacterized protein LOC131146790 [Malania oleifera]